MTDQPEKARQIRPFADWLREYKQGALHEELSLALNDVMTGVDDHLKPGSFTVVIKIEPGKDNKVVKFISDDVKVKLPQAKKEKAVYFTDKHGNAVRNDPNQMTFDSLREVTPKDDPEEVRDVRRAAAGDTE